MNGKVFQLCATFFKLIQIHEHEARGVPDFVGERACAQKPVVGKNDIGSGSGHGGEAKTYRVVDYVNNREYGTVEGPTAKLSADFQGNLLLEATQTAQ